MEVTCRAGRGGRGGRGAVARRRGLWSQDQPFGGRRSEGEAAPAPRWGRSSTSRPANAATRLELRWQTIQPKWPVEYMTKLHYCWIWRSKLGVAGPCSILTDSAPSIGILTHINPLGPNQTPSNFTFFHPFFLPIYLFLQLNLIHMKGILHFDPIQNITFKQMPWKMSIFSFEHFP